MPDTKIATCCYCGTRAALVLKGQVRHELACGACGAPLHDLKRLRADHPDDRFRAGPARPARQRPYRPQDDRDRRKKKKKGKSFSRRLFAEAFDVLEDIFD